MDSFGERIDYLIKLEGLSARKAAKVFDVSPTHIQKMRTGTSIPGGDVLSKIVAALLVGIFVSFPLFRYIVFK